MSSSAEYRAGLRHIAKRLEARGERDHLLRFVYIIRRRTRHPEILRIDRDRSNLPLSTLLRSCSIE
jgi:hypothetical protein